MNMQQLECFTTLAKTLNYAKTAEQLSLSQPAVSRQIQSLETELNAKLFNRTTRSVSLTPVGFQFLDDAQQMLSLYYHSLEWISTFHQQKRTVLRIGYADFHDDAIAFQRLCDDAFVCVVNKQHPLAQKCKKRHQKASPLRISGPIAKSLIFHPIC